MNHSVSIFGAAGGGAGLRPAPSLPPCCSPYASASMAGACLPYACAYRKSAAENHALADARLFVGDCPHPLEAAESHALAEARLFVGDCPHPQEAAKNYSLRGNKATPRRSWAPAHTRKKRQKITRLVATRPLRVVRGRLPTPAGGGRESRAR